MKLTLPKHKVAWLAAMILMAQLAGFHVQTGSVSASEDSGGSSQTAAAAAALPGQTPIMGWSSWNAFHINISEQLIKEQADAMVSSGMADAGYQYVNLDDGYFGGRDENGVLYANSKFPSGMKSLADYIHSKGLKAGIYTDAGKVRCAAIWDNDPYFPEGGGSYGYRQLDFDTFIDTWGYDFVKVDWCGGERQGLDPETEYTSIKGNIDAIGKEVVYEVCNWGFPGAWVTEVGSQWRISGDIAPNFNSITRIIDLNADLAQYAGPGHFNHMDMLQVGNGMSYEEDKSHFSMWAIMASPLIAGNDLRTMSEQTKSILTNKEVIAVNQDPMGLQGVRAIKNGNQEIWVKPLENRASGAIALFNRGNSAVQMTVNWEDVGLSGSVSVRDLWEHEDKGRFEGSYSATVPAHGIVMLKVKGNSAIGMETIYYNKNSGTDVAVQMADNGKAFLGIDNAGQALVSGRDYASNGQQIIIKKNYLTSLPEGRTTLQAVYADGWSQTIAIEIYGEKLTYYLSDLPWVSATSGWQSVKRDKGHEGYDLKLNGIVYKKGLWTNSNSVIVYDLDGQYQTFKAIVGPDDFRGDPPGAGTVTFEVWTDGVKQFDSGLMRSSDNKTQEVNVNVEGVKDLKLVVTDGGDNNWYDRSIWADAKLLKAETPAEPAVVLTGPATIAGGETFTVDLALENLTQSIYAQDIRLDYDANRFELIGAAAVAEGVGLLESVRKEGEIRLILASQGAAYAIAGDLKVIELTFKAKEVAQSESGSIAVTEAILADGQGSETNAASNSLNIVIDVPGVPGDLNGDGRVSIGDLAIIAAHYGKTSESPDWTQAKRADMNKDGKIDLEDLVEVARRILE